MLKKIPLVCVVGPTASGKTKLSIEIAKLYNGEVVSADSMQIYKYMSIGTAKPTIEEMDGIPHHCIDLITPDKTFSVAEYVEYARASIADIAERGKLPILAGGTGLYVNSLVDNITFTPTPSSTELRSELKKLGDIHGNEYLWHMLNKIDPELAQNLHPNNQGRVIRGIEIYRLTGVTMTEHQRLSRLHESPYNLCMLGLNYSNRQTLYDRIDLRVDLMVKQGLLDEVHALIDKGYSKTSVQAIGYKEFFDYLEGKISLNEAVERVKQETRRYAKRQLTWFRRDRRIHWLNIDEFTDFNQLMMEVSQLIDKRKGVN